jgi:hypothetical protein
MTPTRGNSDGNNRNLREREMAKVNENYKESLERLVNYLSLSITVRTPSVLLSLSLSPLETLH